MTQTEIEQYVKSQLQLKRSTEEIGNDLLSKGVDKTSIDKAFTNTKAMSVGFKKKPLLSSIVLSLVLILFGIVRLSAIDNGFNHIIGYIFIAAGGITLVVKLMGKY